jgi:hypothetical protein
MRGSPAYCYVELRHLDYRNNLIYPLIKLALYKRPYIATSSVNSIQFNCCLIARPLCLCNTYLRLCNYRFKGLNYNFNSLSEKQCLYMQFVISVFVTLLLHLCLLVRPCPPSPALSIRSLVSLASLQPRQPRLPQLDHFYNAAY